MRIIGGHAQAILRVDDFRVRVPISVRDPGSITRVEHGLERCYQPARRNGYLDGFPFALMLIWLPIRNYKQPTAIEPRSHMH